MSSQEQALEGSALQALYEISVLAAAGLNEPATVARVAGEYASRLLRVEAAAVFVWDPGTGLLEPIYETPSSQPEPAVPPGIGLVGEVFETGQPIAVDDYQAYSGRLPSSARRGMRSAIAVPMLLNGRPIGVLGVWSYEVRQVESSEVHLLSIFASQIAPAVEAARSSSQIRERRDAMQALQDVAMAIAGVHDPVEVARMSARIATDLLGATTATIVWYDSERQVLEPLAEYNSPATSAYDLRPGEGASGIAFSTRSPVLVADYLNWPHAVPGSLASGIRSIVAVPLLVRDRALGAISAASLAPGQFGTREGELLGLFASLIAPDLEVAQLLERSEEHVREVMAREKELRLVYSAMACGVVVWDREGRIVQINDNGLELFGVPRPQLDGRTPADAAGYRRLTSDGSPLRSEDRPMLIALRTGRPVRNHIIGYQKPDGDVLWLQFDCVPVQDGEGRIERVIGSFIDVTGVKRAEAARRESEAKSHFVAAMSHELRTPLNSILGFAQLLESEQFGPLSERQRRYVAHIASSGRHLLALVNDVLDISKVSAGHMDIVLEPVDVHSLVGEVVGRIVPLAGARSVAIRPSAPPPAGVVARADKRRLQQVLNNLLSNAIKFTDESGRIVVEARRRRHEVVVAVRDNGIGIAPENIERVFDEFTQLDDSRSRRVDGTGLGLSLSRHLVERMGGRLWVESQPGQGSSFYFSLPVPPPAPA